MRSETSHLQLTDQEAGIRDLLTRFADHLEYIDIRLEEALYSSLVGRNGIEAQTVTSEEQGYAVRVQHRGVWHSLCTTEWGRVEVFLEGVAREHAADVCSSANLALSANRYADDFQKLIEFRQVTKETTLQTLQMIFDYANLIGLGIASYRYFDRSKQLLFLNSTGSTIYQIQNNANLYLECFLASDGVAGEMLPISASEAGAPITPETIRPLLHRVREQVGDLQQPVASPAGIYDVVMAPELAGTFFHEAAGHPSEADTYDPNIYSLGDVIGPTFLNVSDRPLDSEGYLYDDEGVRSQECPIIENGRFSYLLHSRQTASDRADLSGNGRAVSYRYAPICRMRQTYVQPGTASVEELLEALGDGLYLIGYLGGSTYGNQFTMSCAFGYYVQGGRVRGAFPSVTVVGNIREALSGIEQVGGDCTLVRDAGGCDKALQNALPNEMRSPSILVRGLQIGDFSNVE